MGIFSKLFGRRQSTWEPALLEKMGGGDPAARQSIAAPKKPEAEDPKLAYRRKKYYNCDLTPLPECYQEQFAVAGTSLHKKELAALGEENPDYKMDKMQLYRAGLLDSNVYAIRFGPVTAKLEPEPDNPKDKNAVKVLLNGQHIGYVKASAAPKVLSLLAADRIRRIQAQPYGGDYRTLTYDGGYLPDGERAARDELRTEVTRESVGVALFIDFTK